MSRPPARRRGASVALFRGSGAPGGLEVLLALRTRGARAGQWSVPGGHVEPGETDRDAAARELREETGLDLDALACPLPEAPARRVDVGDYRLAVFVRRLAASAYDAPFVAGDDAGACRWVRVDALDARLPLADDTAALLRELARALDDD